ncbi:hypothetical protein EMPS_02426 [Entomortierella parvispora]|uniref:Oligopeptide transporter n=1 Tax=Entomortierella parvispora TaxID=205924 RepID=A0A9P3H4U9_9FUNG|nr:hypothetical protein EMPS_02426 [Entomortierella parvispora]
MEDGRSSPTPPSDHSINSLEMSTITNVDGAERRPTPNGFDLADYKSFFRNNLLSGSPPFSRQPPPYSLQEPGSEEPIKDQSEPLHAEEEVRSTIPNRDDPTTPCNTFRMWLLGIFFSVATTFLNQFFSFRDARFSIAYPVPALLSLPLGHLLAKILPRRRFRIRIGGWKRQRRAFIDRTQPIHRGAPPLPGSGGVQEPQQYVPRFEYTFSLNPGPFTAKEHALIGAMVSCATATNYVSEVLFLERSLFPTSRPFVSNFCMALILQILGYGIAGGLRRILIQPAEMVWPNTLAMAALFRSLHSRKAVEFLEAQQDRAQEQGVRLEQIQAETTPEVRKKKSTGRMSRMKYFWWVALFSFVWYWIPEFIMPTLGYLSVLCWISPKSKVLSQLTGSTGLGIGTFTFNWGYISNQAMPLITPWSVQANLLAGLVLFSWMIYPGLYYSDAWGAKSYPIRSYGLFDTEGGSYNIFKVIDDQLNFNQAAYEAYGPVRIPMSTAMSMGLGFAVLSATCTHTVLYHGRDLKDFLTSGIWGREDVHTRMMRAYPEVPDLWYQILMIVMTLMTVITLAVNGYMPWWGSLLAIGLNLIFIIPIGIITAVTNQTPMLNILSEYIMGFAYPGHVMANATFNALSFNLISQVTKFLSGLKLGHYLKVPPRIMFTAQVTAGILGALVQLLTYEWIFTVQPNVCDGMWACPGFTQFQTSSFLWGAIGPSRLFGKDIFGGSKGEDGRYAPIQLGFILGVFLPLLTWFLAKRFPVRGRWLNKVHWPVMLSAGLLDVRGPPFYLMNGIIVGFISMYVLRRYRHAWWCRYNYITSVALDTGVALAAITLFLTIETNDIEMPSYWGSPDDLREVDHCPLGGLSYR